MATWSGYLEENSDRFLQELIEFCKIPSISSLPQHAGDVRKAGEWVKNRLQTAGIDSVKILETGGHPVVFGQKCPYQDRPTVLIYGHFDVQPADPLNLWESPPFEPRVENGRLYARGASDDKGNLLIPILAVEALLKEGEPPLNLKFLFEGQEEIGSPQIPDFVAENKDLLACDLAVSADGYQWTETQPCLKLGLRGLCALEIELKGPDKDLHSGVFGGAVQNPIHALAALLASMKSSDGRITVRGFYDEVLDFSEAQRKQIADIPFDKQKYMSSLGIPDMFGEPGFSPREQTWIRPTLEINGIWGGFMEEGTKTVLPSKASAKITCRLVPDQDPQKVVQAIMDHVNAHLPPGVTANMTPAPVHAMPYLMEPDHPANKKAGAVLEKVYGKAPYFVRTGGTIPIYAVLEKNLGIKTVTLSFGLEDENHHSPNEYFRLNSFKKGQTVYGLLLQEMAKGL